MVIKSLTRKTASYKQLLEYFFKEQKGKAVNDNGFIIRHNIKGTTISQWTKAFEINEADRKIKRSNSVRLYHEVMSISNLDRSKISKALLQDLANKYIELRNPNSLCIAVPHYDKDHIHIHFCFSGTEIETGKSLRVSKEEFANFKKELQAYQMQRYPALSNSIVEHGKKKTTKKDRIKDREYQLKKRTKEPSDRERVKQTIETCYSKSLSQADFMHRLSQQGVQTYSRRGTIKGIESKRNYRFGSLGYDEKKLGELNYRDEALKGIQVFRDDKTKEREFENEMPLERELPYITDIDSVGRDSQDERKVGTDHETDDLDSPDEYEIEEEL